MASPPNGRFDLNIGGTTSGWRYFDNGKIKINHWGDGPRGRCAISDPGRGRGLEPLDSLAHLSRRRGIARALTPSTSPFSPGVRSAAIEPELLLRKTSSAGRGLGIYGDALYRWKPHHRQRPVYRGVLVCSSRSNVGSWILVIAISKPSVAVTLNSISSDPTSFGYLFRAMSVRISESIEAGFKLHLENTTYPLGLPFPNCFRRKQHR